VNVADLLKGQPDGRRALIASGRSWSYGELREKVAAARATLRASGVGEGDNVALACGNSVSFVVCYLAVLSAGAVAVPLNPSAPGPELARELRQVEVAATFVEPQALGGSSGLEGAPAGELIEVGVARGSGARLGRARPRRPHEAARAQEAVDRSPGALAALLFTSGTAGAPRAACLTHGNLLANLEQIAAEPALAVRADDVTLGALPLFHVFGLCVVLGATLAAGATLVLMEHFTPRLALDAIRDSGVTLLPGVPTMFAALTALAAERGGDARLPSVRRAVSGAAPLGEDTQAEFSERFGMPLWQGYGLTEAAPVVTSTLVSGRPKPGSIGAPVPGVEVRLVDTDGSDSLVGDPGEIWVSGPNVFQGYWRDPEATRQVLTPEGWLKTGDVAVVDHDGDLALVDRAKDLVIVSGFNVFPAEVEEVLVSHPAVADAAVLGVPDSGTGQAVKAMVVPAEGAELDGSQLAAYCSGQLARYKCPRDIEVVPELPRSPTGKLLRRSLAPGAGSRRPDSTI
jgi:long-chain acyl-CoA synthetase